MTRPPPPTDRRPVGPGNNHGHSHARSTNSPLLLIIEGINDVAFLRRISIILHEQFRYVAPLQKLEQQGRLVFLPLGGGRVADWIDRLEPVGCAEFHIYDREVPPETEFRQRAVQQINARRNCTAVVMRKRSLENYLHPAAVFAARGVRIEFDDADSVPDLVAQYRFEQTNDTSWDELSRRARRRLANYAKRWLNTAAAERMTVSMLAARDPRHEILSWLSAITAMSRRA